MRIPRPERILRAVAGRPWAIDESKAQEIVEFLEFRVDGGIRSEEELRAITGLNRDPMQERGGGNGVAVIHLFGTIAHRLGGLEAFSGGASLESFRKQFQAALQSEDIGTIVLHIDSPGGSVEGVAETSQMIYEARGKKDIVAVGDTLMASAAYAIASAADEIVLTPSGRAGSIGVIAIHFEFSEMEKAAGIATTVFTAGRFKGEGNRHEPLGEDARSHIQETVDDYYEQFVDTVARNRGVTPDMVRSGMGQGRALTAKRALEEKIVDRIATYDDVLDDLGVSRTSRIERRATSEEVSPMAGSEENGGGDAPCTADAGADELEPVEPGGATTEKTPDAVGDAPSATHDTPEPETPNGEEENMAETATAPQAGAGPSVDDVRKEESKRAQDIATLCALHEMGGRAAGWIEQGRSADWVGREILRLKGEQVVPTRTAQPSDERPEAPAVIRRRHSSREEEPGFQLGMTMLGMAAAKRGQRDGKAVDAAKFVEEGGFPEIASAMRSDRAGAGGSWVPENYLASEFIELLRPESVVRRMNPRYWPLTGGNATVPKLTGGATAYYKGEAQRGTASEATTGRVNLVAKQLMAFVPMTNQQLQRATPDAAMTVRDDSLAAVAERSDLAFIRGDGTEHSPKGLRHLAAAGNVFDANGTVNLANVTEDLGLAKLKLRDANVKFRRPGWIFAPRTEHYLRTVRDGNGNYAFREEMNDGTLDGMPFGVTTQIPTNLGSGSDESEVYVADFAEVVVGEEETIRIDVFDQVTYWDGSAWVSAAQNDEVVLRIVAEHDIGLRHDAAVSILTAVKWGA